MNYFQSMLSAEVEGITPQWVTQITELQDLAVENYYGITFEDTWLLYRKYSMQPNQEELESAPDEVKNLISEDLGLLPEDEFSLQLDIPHHLHGFGFRIIPRNDLISDEKIGIGLSSYRYGGDGVYGIIYDSFSPHVLPVKSVGFFDDNPSLHGRGRATLRKYNSILARAYPERPHFFHTEPPAGSIPLHQLLEAISNWSLSLIEARKKPN